MDANQPSSSESRKSLSELFRIVWLKACGWFWISPWINSIILFLVLVIVVSGAMSFFLLIGVWTFETEAAKLLCMEINFQLLNAIFSLATLVDCPKRIRGLYRALSFISLKKALRFKLKEQEGSGASVTEKQFRDIASTIQSEHPWFGRLPSTDTKIIALTEISSPASSGDTHVDVVVSEEGASPNTLALSPIELQTVQSSTEELLDTQAKGMLLAFISFNISTIAQCVISYYMWFYHPASIRPPLALAVCVPIAISSSLGAIGYLGVQQYRYHKLRQQLQQ
jgi:hypothetical protein